MSWKEEPGYYKTALENLITVKPLNIWAKVHTSYNQKACYIYISAVSSDKDYGWTNTFPFLVSDYSLVNMGLHFGDLAKIRHIITYSLSPFEQRAFPNYFSKGIPNLWRRFTSSFFKVGPRKSANQACQYLSWTTSCCAQICWAFWTKDYTLYS